jgi:hypothetical protein
LEVVDRTAESAEVTKSKEETCSVVERGSSRSMEVVKKVVSGRRETGESEISAQERQSEKKRGERPEQGA